MAKNYRQVRRRGALAWAQVLHAVALAIGDLDEGAGAADGGSYGFCMRDSPFVRRRGWLGGLVKDVDKSVRRASGFVQMFLVLIERVSGRDWGPLHEPCEGRQPRGSSETHSR